MPLSSTTSTGVTLVTLPSHRTLHTTGAPGATVVDGHDTSHAPPTASIVTEKFPAAGAVTVTVPETLTFGAT